MCYKHISVTDDGLFTIQSLGSLLFWRGKEPKLVVAGDFSGCCVLEPHSPDPINISTKKIHGMVVVVMVGKYFISWNCVIFQHFLIDPDTGDIFREIPVSVLPSDVAPGSHVVKLALDSATKELFITDSGCLFVIKVGILDNLCSQSG